MHDRFSLLSTRYAQKLRIEERASGIQVEQTELDSLLEEILEREKDAKRELDSKDSEKKSKADKEKATAEERERSDKEREYKKEELKVRKREIEVQAEKHNQAQKEQQGMFSALMAQMQQQQQYQQKMQTLLVAQQQQQQNKLRMAFMENSKKE
ncbi:hypothetical protein OS493_007051 [Desmophyllum pertusum]|uniref:Uncharacterized protein n=1 Tax=Desmophyllum pertusum TaxID=174260 RepID=A0A9X0D0U9_9CNID|nr:hypothetical protein OS493_007051 [Desmophyllum pertusum]